LGTPIGISALRDRNLDQVVNAIRKNADLTDAPTELPQPQMLVAIVGKRNAGKSTLVNAIAKHYEGDPERVIVSEVPGTTRDSVDVQFEKDGKTRSSSKPPACARSGTWRRTTSSFIRSTARSDRSVAPTSC
jgi:GTP-binding protein